MLQSTMKTELLKLNSKSQRRMFNVFVFYPLNKYYLSILYLFYIYFINSFNPLGIQKVDNFNPFFLTIKNTSAIIYLNQSKTGDKL